MTKPRSSRTAHVYINDINSDRRLRRPWRVSSLTVICAYVYVRFCRCRTITTCSVFLFFFFDPTPFCLTPYDFVGRRRVDSRRRRRFNGNRKTFHPGTVPALGTRVRPTPRPEPTGRFSAFRKSVGPRHDAFVCSPLPYPLLPRRRTWRVTERLSTTKKKTDPPRAARTHTRVHDARAVAAPQFVCGSCLIFVFIFSLRFFPTENGRERERARAHTRYGHAVVLYGAKTNMLTN